MGGIIQGGLMNVTDDVRPGLPSEYWDKTED
jgi:hypothetical protein